MTDKMVTVILPTFSRFKEGYLERAIQSVLGQTYTNFELIICDDGSVDGSESLIRSYAQANSKIKYIRLNRNLGIPAMVSLKAYLESSGYYIAMVFDDCILLPDHLETLVDVYQKHPEIGMVYGQARAIWADGQVTVFGGEFNRQTLLTGANFIPNVSVMTTRAVMEEVGWYDPHVILKRYCDWDLWIRISERYPVKFIEKVIAEENGLKLGDSLGNTYSVFNNIVMKYIKTHRNEELKPNKLVKFDPFKLPTKINLSALEEEQYCYLVLEHYVKTLDLNEITNFAQKQIINSNLEDHKQLQWKKITNKNLELPNETLYLFWGLHNYYETKLQELGQQIREKQAYIFKQQREIDEKQCYIDMQRELIDKHSNESYIQILKRLAKRILNVN